jgi:PadR family transcriptional regulator, regulatory protein AphA
MQNKPIRLTSTSYAVLGLLNLLGQATPYDLKRALETSIENFWPVPHTTFYAEPTRLAAGGYLSEQQEPGGRRRKLYALTDLGRHALREWASSPEIAPPQLRDEGVLKIFAGADPQPIFEQQRAWHQAKLVELEGYLEKMRCGDERTSDDHLRGVEATLIAGTTYHRQLIEGFELSLRATSSSTES